MTISPPLSLRVPQKKALLIAVRYGQLRDWNLELPATHRDPITTRNLLQDVYGWKSEDITILMDDGKHRDPTRDNIIQAMKELVMDAQSGDHFVFMFSGHGGQVADLDNDEDDGFDEVIWPSDIQLDQIDLTYQKNCILDDEIKKILVASLPAESRLVMLFDCCHSGTIADLAFRNGDECPQSPDTARPAGRLLGNRNGPPQNYTITTTVQQDYTEEVDIMYSSMSNMENKSKTITVNKPVQPYVTSWSACKDNQLTLESDDGCFIAAFARALRANPNQTHSEMLWSVTREMELITQEANATCGLGFTPARPQLGSLQKVDEIYPHPLVL
ncbi:peptidase C14, caspase domain-containing protein [Cristinia sonorae]|uniref:Peptidase C14, caspase domain-containing protein n=1 Tax=Cristinia sonorae TaxID=1940300 RepID=A0A8K0UNU4_9AGAR|nr:peptidase C14, caspase domain-containing protein [Cristinia sonorae]